MCVGLWFFFCVFLGGGGGPVLQASLQKRKRAANREKEGCGEVTEISGDMMRRKQLIVIGAPFPGFVAASQTYSNDTWDEGEKKIKINQKTSHDRRPPLGRAVEWPNPPKRSF